MALFKTFKSNKVQMTLLALIASQSVQSITLEPIQVLSSPDELLYAEIRFSQADTLDGMTVSVASDDDLASLGITEKLRTEHLNFYSRSNSYGDGVITITSNQPLNTDELNVVIKIQQGNATRLQHVRTPLKSMLTPSQIANNERSVTPLIVSEKDIILDLPESTLTLQSPPTTEQQPSTTGKNPVISTTSNPTAEPTTAVETAAPKPKETRPTLAQATPVKDNTNTAAQATPATETTTPPAAAPETQQQAAQTATPTKKQQTAVAQNLQHNISALGAKTHYQSPFLVIQRVVRTPDGQIVAIPPQQTSPTTPETQQPTQPASSESAAIPPAENKPATNTASVEYVVKKNETLWIIARDVAAQTKQPIGHVMKQIHEQNPNAFIDSNLSRLRQGAILNLAVAPSFSQPSTQQTTAQKAEQKTAPAKPKPSTQPTTKTAAKPMPAQPTQKTTRPTQAQMSLVAESKENSAHGSAKTGTGGNITSANLNKKVMQARAKTVHTQKNVSSLESSLKSKDQKLQILNARLAQLEKQLKAKQAQQKKN